MYREGNYQATVLAQQFGESKEKKTPYFALTIRPDEFENGDPEGESVSGQERTIFMYLTDGTAEIVARDLQAIGFEGASFADLDPEEGKHSFVGRKVSVRCKHETYKDKATEKWSINSGGGGLRHEALDKKGIRRLDSLFGKHLKKARTGGGNGQKVTAGATDDAVPF